VIKRGLAGRLSAHLTPIPSAAGLHISATARTASPEEMTDVARRALAAGVAIQPLSRFQITRPPLAGVALGYGAIEADDIDEGLLRLGPAFGTG
jgi:GntR family transcriptional regulator/MocR family aminotransferase